MKTILFLTAACTLITANLSADTKLVTDGAPLRYLVPTDGSLGGTWRDPAFNDSSWRAGQNGIGYEVNPGAYNARVIADSQAEWSTGGQQGENSWINGYYDKSEDPDGTFQANDFQPFPRSDGPWGPDNFWDGGGWEWFAGDPPWDSIYRADVHPNGENNGEEHWVIRRWHSTTTGPITLRFHVRKTNLGGTGTTGKIFQNGVEIFSRGINGNDGTGFDVYVNTVAAPGDVFDFAHTPVGLSGDPGDGADGSIMTATVLSGTIVPPEPPVGPTPVADSVNDWSSSGTQGANGWFYGFYNRTADADSTYNPNTDFNMTDPNWTFVGDWVLGEGGDPNANPPWDTIGQTGWHPNGDNQPQGIHWVIRRWVSDVDGDLHARVKFAKANVNGNGTTLHVLRNGTDVYSVTLNNTTGVDTIVSLPGIFVGDRIEFALDPVGTDGSANDGADSSIFSTTIFSGPPPQTVVADTVADWSATGTQGANGWYYGFYNLTADGNATYEPATDFNTTDPNWTFDGSAWTLGPGDPPWDIIGQTDWHPNGDNQVEGVHFVIKRWVSEVDGDLHAKVQFGKQNPNGSGSTLRVFHNGTQVFSHTVAGSDTTGIDTAIPLPSVFIGDTIEFALDSLGTDGSRHDGADGSYLRASIVTGLPPEPPRPFVPGIADCFRTDVEAEMRGVNPSLFIRIPFDVANPAAIETLKLKMKYNDGFVAYLNGTEIARRNTPTVITGVTMADSMADWSTTGTQGENGWYYGYYNQSLDANSTYGGGTDFTQFPRDGGGHSPTDFWTGDGYDWFNGNPPWLELFREATHPSHPNGAAFDPNVPTTHIHWAIRRWVADVDGNLSARIRFRKLNTGCGDGVRLSVFQNNVQVYTQTIAGTDGVGRDDTIEIPDVFIGDTIDVLLGPGEPTGNDFCDGTAFSVVLFEGQPSIPWNGTATGTRTTAETISPEVFDLTAFRSQLVAGQNILAIQGFNAAVADNEFLINAELLANRVPTAANDTVTAIPDTTTTYPGALLLANDSDPDGDQLQLVGVTPTYVTAQGGSVRLYGDTVRYTPPAAFTGSDSFQYTITDLSGAPIRATVTVTVEQPNRCPSSSPLTMVVDQNSTTNFQLSASDPDGDPLVYSITAAPQHGVVVLQVATGAGSYTPNPGYCGPDSFKFKVSDGQCDSAEATVSITVINCNECPTANNSSVSVDQDSSANFQLSASDPDGDALQYTITQPPTHGVVVLQVQSGAGTYTPNAGYCGPDSFRFKVNDGQCDSAEATVSITVECRNGHPICVARISPSKCGVTFESGGQLFAIAVKKDYVCLTLDGSGSTDPDGDPLTVNWIIDGTNLVSGTVVTNCMDVGCHTITMIASDGRTNCHQFLDLCVITPSEAVEQCILLVENTQVDRKNKRPLLVSLKAAKAAFDREGWRKGAQMLRVFQNKVRAQISRRNPEEAALFIECAENIIDALECVIKTPRKGDDDGDDDDDRTRDDDDNGGPRNGDDDDGGGGGHHGGDDD